MNAMNTHALDGPWRGRDLVRNFPAPEQVPALAFPRQLDALISALDTRGVDVAVSDEVPDHVLYGYLHQYVGSAHFEAMPPGARILIDGCNGDCNDCFQRRWCSVASDVPG